MTMSVSALAKRFGLSRSTLLYYDSIGLLSPKARSSANYRVYGPSDIARMEEIAQLRSAGVPLEEIRSMLGKKVSRRSDVLRKRLSSINAQMRLLRDQQRFIVGLLGDEDIGVSSRVLSKEKWIAYLRKAGLDDAGMMRWHAEFEASSPEAHQDFLESLGIAADEIKAIRERCRPA